MRKSTKIWLIIATSLVVIGGIIFVGTMQKLKWDFTKLSTVKYETNEYVIQEDYRNLTIITDTSNVEIVMSEDTKTKVVCYEQKKLKHAVEIKNNTLEIEVDDTRKWYEYIGIDFESPKITVYMPQGQYDSLSVKLDTGNVKISKEFEFERIEVLGNTGDIKNCASASGEIRLKTSTGHIEVVNISAGTIHIGVSTGDVKVTDVACQDIISKGTTGNVSLKNVIAKEKISIERSTGDVIFEESDAQDILVKTNTGNVKGTLLSDKVYIVETNTGEIDVPKTTTGGVCEITTSTGDIKIRVK